MIVIPIFAVILALAIDFAFGDPKNKYHPTVWIGKLVSKVVSLARSNNPISEKLGGTIVVMCVLVIVCILIMSLVFGLKYLNNIDSMIGYKTDLFRNIGWFGANCDKVLNYLPSRITSLVMILASIILKENWRHSLEVMRRDGPKTESPNAGYPMATMAGALGIRFEKLDHYILGDGISDITETHFKLAVSIMKLTSILFVALFTIPVIAVLSYLGWWSFV